MGLLTQRKRVAVLRGGPSSEYDVSMKTGKSVLEVLEDDMFGRDIVISKKGEWLVNGLVKSPEQALMDIDVAFVALHGAYGEDGTVQRILERYSVPYTGSDSYASALAMNKVLTKEFLKKHNLPIKMPRHLKITATGSTNLSQTIFNLSEVFGPEYVVKPVNAGSSIGVTLSNKSDLYEVVKSALDKYEELIVEERIFGKEATVGVIENFRGSRLYDLPALEIVPPAGAGFYTSDMKFEGGLDEFCPGRFSKDEKAQLGHAAREVHRVLGLRDYSRSDFIVAQDGIYFLEVNSLPGLTVHEPFAIELRSIGSDIKEFVNQLVV